MWKLASCVRTMLPLASVGVKAFSTVGGATSLSVALAKPRTVLTTLPELFASSRRSFAGFSLQSFLAARPPLAAASATSSVVSGALPPMTLPPARGMATLEQMHRTGPHRRKRRKRRPLDGRPQMKGVVLKTVIKKPRKPNSANRKCVIVRLSNGKEMTAYVPGEGHNLQEHNMVLVRVGRLQDVPGVKIKVIRGKYDCAPVVKKTVLAK